MAQDEDQEGRPRRGHLRAAQRNGGDRGKQGKVIAVYPERQRVLVEGVNRVTKHTKAGTDRPRHHAPAAS